MVNYLIRVYIKIFGGVRWWLFYRKTRCPRKIQQRLLLDIIQRQKNTQFSKDYHFETISDISDFRTQVPVLDYDDLRPYIANQGVGKNAYLNSERPIQFCQTSGTTSLPKYIPTTQSIVKQLKRYSLLTAYQQLICAPHIYDGSILSFSSSRVEGHTESGERFGSMSGLLFDCLPNCLKKKYLLPSVIFSVNDYHSRYLLIAAFSLADSNITVINCANPSTLLKIIETIRDHWDILYRCLSSHQLNALNLVDTVDISNLQKYFHVDDARIQYLQKLAKSHEALTFDRLWPKLAAIATWKHGNCAVLMPKLQALLSKKLPIMDPGLLASELVGSISLADIFYQSLPIIDENFYEFIPIDQLESDRRSHQCMLLDELSIGQKYYLIVTTKNGLYRYFLNDIVEVVGLVNQTPTIRFVQKGKGVTSLTGEKLYKSQLIEAVDRACKQLSIQPTFYLMLGDVENLCYTLYLQHKPLTSRHSDFVKILDQWLSKTNVEYCAKRASDRLNCVNVVYVKPGTQEAYKLHQIKLGQREGQFKLIKLQYTADNSFAFADHEYED